jgi:hypothetical protein
LIGRFPSTSIQPDEAIVRGACVQAGLKSKDIALKECKLMINSYRRKMEQADKARRYHTMKIHYHNLQNQIRENQIKHFEAEIEDIKKYGDYNEQ